MLPRFNRLFGADGRCLDVAIDHGFFNERSFSERHRGRRPRRYQQLSTLLQTQYSFRSALRASCRLCLALKPALVLANGRSQHLRLCSSRTSSVTHRRCSSSRSATRCGLRSSQPAPSARTARPPRPMCRQRVKTESRLRSLRNAADGRASGNERITPPPVAIW